MRGCAFGPSFRRKPESSFARHSGEGRNPVLLLLFGSVFGAVARTDSRPCAVRRPSLVAGHFLLLAQKKVTKEKGTLGAAPSPAARVRYGRTGFFHRPSMACGKNRRDPSRRPRALHAADPSALRRGLRGNPRAKGE